MRPIIAAILRTQAKRYLRKFTPKIIVVSGSVGKSSTTQAIAKVLEQKFRVGRTLKNYNTNLGVPCSIFQLYMPEKLKNPFSWVKLLILAENQIRQSKESQPEIFVLELGSDKIGELQTYAWLKPDVAVITAVSPEHMEYFKTIDAVAKEELSVAGFSEAVFLNEESINEDFYNYVENDNQYFYRHDDIALYDLLPNDLKVIGTHSLFAVSAALAVGKFFELTNDELREGARNITPIEGRMRRFEGHNKSVIIDDTYNASPEATIAALRYLYEEEAPQKIALLGNMNELGDVSADEHTRIGNYCDPKKIDLVVTLGVDANRYTAEAAKDKGCEVIMTNSPYQAGEIIKERIKTGALVLCKGSQNGVFAEESVKILLANPADRIHLVRQNDFWMKIKAQQFKEDSDGEAT